MDAGGGRACLLAVTAATDSVETEPEDDESAADVSGAKDARTPLTSPELIHRPSFSVETEAEDDEAAADVSGA